MVNDENNGVVRLDENGQEVFDAAFSATRSTSAWPRRSTSRATCSSRRARRRCSGPGWPRRTCRARAGWAADPERSVVDADGAVVGRQAPVRRRRLRRPAHALGQPVADDHGAREPPGRAISTKIRTDTSPDRAHSRPRAPLARRAADAEARREPRVLPGDPRHGGGGRARRLGLPARLRRLRARVAEADDRGTVGDRAHRLPHAQPRGARAPRRRARGDRRRRRVDRRRPRPRRGVHASSIRTGTASSSSTSRSATRRRRSCGRR